jgi:hypothetical protein
LALFDKVFLLQASQKTLVHRVDTRTEHDFGKAPAEKERLLKTYKAVERKLLMAKAVPINAQYPVSVIADSIVSKIG